MIMFYYGYGSALTHIQEFNRVTIFNNEVNWNESVFFICSQPAFAGRMRPSWRFCVAQLKVSLLYMCNIINSLSLFW